MNKPLLNINLTSTENGFIVSETVDHSSKRKIHSFETVESLTAHIREVAHRYEQDRVLTSNLKGVSSQDVSDYLADKHPTWEVLKSSDYEDRWAVHCLVDGIKELEFIGHSVIADWKDAQ